MVNDVVAGDGEVGMAEEVGHEGAYRSSLVDGPFLLALAISLGREYY